MRISEERASISNGIDMAYRQKDYTYNPKLTSEENIVTLINVPSVLCIMSSADEALGTTFVFIDVFIDVNR